MKTMEDQLSEERNLKQTIEDKLKETEFQLIE